MRPISVESAGRPPARPHGRVAWRPLLWQAIVVAAVCALVTIVAAQVASNLKARGIASGFGYLGRGAGFELPPGLIGYSSQNTYGRALALGVSNTLRVSAVGIVMAAGLGLLIGVSRLSRIWFVSILARVYVEVMRNTPLLLQLLFWYSLWQALPGPHESLEPLPGVFLNSRGLFLPGVDLQATQPWLSVSRPALAGFDFRGGWSMAPEFAALLAGLATCTAAFIGEIVRGGILAVPQGQIEAAASLGLSRLRTLRLVVVPQAMPMIVPPTTTQFLNLAKNSSLAVAIGYPDLISITNTTLNQTGQAVEAIAIAAACYLAISLAVSFLMHRYGESRHAHGATQR